MPRELSSNRPYLIRAMHEWMTDNGLTPHIVIDANFDGLALPAEHVSDGKLVLNVSHAAARHLDLANEVFSFEVRFGGVPRRFSIPPAAVLGIYARETGQGMAFAEEVPPLPDGGGEPGPSARKPTLSVVK